MVKRPSCTDLIDHVPFILDSSNAQNKQKEEDPVLLIMKIVIFLINVYFQDK
jgi:hypothetical protein